MTLQKSLAWRDAPLKIRHGRMEMNNSDEKNADRKGRVSLFNKAIKFTREESNYIN